MNSHMQEIKLNEQELIASARNGDHEAFKVIVKKNESRIAATVIGMLGYCQEAEDIGQETFIRFYKSLDRFRGEAGLATYLTRIAINLSLNEIRRRKRQRKLFFTKSDDSIEDIADAHNHNDKKEIRELIEEGLQKLPSKFRTVLVLRLIDGYSTEETAKILNIPVGTVLSRLSRGQMKLKKILTPLYKEKS
ncbi:MAG: sigma-70 family RNA polymerase sigma factor [Candidatus Aminicenantes bacterium]|nr:sigma-70 family RNA polymerase sigma factor [Candidatus Aminicenantes bacterium]